ncbi:MAG: UDP-3-O-acylglucosamine N-acyltransferase [Bacteroidota bacterium]|nr:MAG: UDP-3-O-acylglucosamine N-acyltransferase [Bacteroidota bacterium]
MNFTASQIADLVSGTVEGNNNAEVNRLSKIEEGEKGSLSFLANPKYTPYLYTTDATITLVRDSFVAEKEFKTTLIRVEDPYDAFSKLLEHYNEIQQHYSSGIAHTAIVSQEAIIAASAFIGDYTQVGVKTTVEDQVMIQPNVYVGNNVFIGANTKIHSGARILDGTIIGKDCVIHSNAVIGADGFGWAPNANGSYDKVPQTGNVTIGDHVDVGANTTIDRATLGATKIGNGVKLDNLIQIGHNVEIGDHTVIAAQTGIAGSTKIGTHCQIGGQVGIGGHLTIGNRVGIQAKSGILKNIKDDGKVMGYPAFDYTAFNKAYVHFRNLHTHISDLNSLKKKLDHE